jgi:phosphonate transport system ATP-binding protein
MRLEIDRISARHPTAAPGAVTAIRGIGFSVEAGEQLAVIGPSGAGKTTLLQALACALKPVSGHLRLDAVDPWTLSRGELQQLRGRLLLAPQVPPLPPRQRVVTSVLAGLLPDMSLWQSLRSLVYPMQMEMADAALAQFDLSEKLFERVDRLSGGERQRVGLARALVAKAELLLIDEPLSALDPTRATQAMEALTQGARASGATLICTLHQVATALEYFPRIIGLRDGELIFDSPSAQVTPERLNALYANRLEELTDSAPAEFAAITSTPSASIMHCR